MSPSLTFLERAAAETGFQVDVLEKVVRLGEMAADVTRHPLLRRALVLKGGTVLNLAFGEPSRLSVDLDLNYVAQVDREAMLEDRPQIEAAVTDLARRHGYAVQASADAFAGRKLYLTYRSAVGPNDRIEVDLNSLMRLPIGLPETRALWQPGGLDTPVVRVVSVTELAVGKLLALLDRCAPRDAWDVGAFPPDPARVVGTHEFRKWLIGMAAVLPSPLVSYTRDRLDARITERAVAQQLAPMLIAGASVRAAELADRAGAVEAPFLRLAQNERAYLDAFDRGELRAEFVFGEDEAAAAVIAGHPAVLWRLQNIRKFRMKKLAQTSG
jgi:predicted nucleotidyltransferase component of viral defense system